MSFTPLHFHYIMYLEQKIYALLLQENLFPFLQQQLLFFTSIIKGCYKILRKNAKTGSKLMKIVGLITEYNPFHSGHLYHMQQAKELTGADYCVVLMSGSFVQRGGPAIFDKYRRTKAALLAGADLVVEMPVAFSTASAHEFAAYGVALLSSLGVDAIVFGSECGQIEWLRQAACALNHESPDFQKRLQAGLREGLTYPQARARAFEHMLPEKAKRLQTGIALSESPAWASVLSSPNNILGIEYLRAAQDLHSPLEFYTISRKGSGYHEEALEETTFPSASAIRSLIQTSHENLFDVYSPFLPAVTHPAYAGAVPVFADDFSELLNTAVLRMQTIPSGNFIAGATLFSGISPANASMPTASPIADLSPELAARLTKPPYCPLSFGERIQALKTRQLTYTRVSRALLHLVLGMREEDISRWKGEGYALYARILGFRRESRSLLSGLHKKSSIPLVTKMADAAQVLSPSARALLEQEVYASHLYQTVRMKRGGSFQNEYTEGLCFV